MPTSLLQPLGMAPEQVAAIVQIILATQGQNLGKLVTLIWTSKKNVTETIVEQSNKERIPRTCKLVLAIQKHMNKLLQVQNDNEICKLPQPTKDTVEAFADGEGEGPKLIPMELAFAYKNKEPWNAHMAEMFFNNFLDNQGEPLRIEKSEWPVIYEKYWQCFGNLKKEWKSWQAKEGKDNKEVKLCNSQKKKKMQKVTRQDARQHHLKDL